MIIALCETEVKNQVKALPNHKEWVKYNSTLNEGFLVHKVDGMTQVFRPSKKGLFFSDVQDTAGHVFVNTVAKNKSKYTIKEYSDAVCTCSLKDIIGHPTTDYFITYIENNMIPNCPVTKAIYCELKTYLEKTSHHCRAKPPGGKRAMWLQHMRIYQQAC